MDFLTAEQFQIWLNSLGRCPTGQELYDITNQLVDDIRWQAEQDGYSDGYSDATRNVSPHSYYNL